MAKAKIRKKKGSAKSLKQHKISTLHAKGRNPSVSMHTKGARVLEKTGGSKSRVYSGVFHIGIGRGGREVLMPGRPLRGKFFNTSDLGTTKGLGGNVLAYKGRADQNLTNLVGDYYQGGRFTGIKLGKDTHTMKSVRGTDPKTGRPTTSHYLSPINV